MKYRILIVEDEDDILELIRYSLEKEGYLVTVAMSGEDAVRLVRVNNFDLILLDLMLPQMDGLEVCKILKRDSKTENIPIMMLTAKSSESDIVTGLELGADDYLTKPFSPKVLIARMRTVLRRQNTEVTQNDSEVIRLGKIQIHPGRHEVLVDGGRIDLTFTEFKILQMLARRPGWVFSRQQIVDSVCGDDNMVTERAVDVHILGLRRKMGDMGKHIETVRGVGYKFTEDYR
jgi:two-component system alkaline phosphatase synthesis response regulator PhoP